MSLRSGPGFARTTAAHNAAQLRRATPAVRIGAPPLARAVKSVARYPVDTGIEHDPGLPAYLAR